MDSCSDLKEGMQLIEPVSSISCVSVFLQGLPRDLSTNLGLEFEFFFKIQRKFSTRWYVYICCSDTLSFCIMFDFAGKPALLPFHEMQMTCSVFDSFLAIKSVPTNSNKYSIL